MAGSEAPEGHFNDGHLREGVPHQAGTRVGLSSEDPRFGQRLVSRVEMRSRCHATVMVVGSCHEWKTEGPRLPADRHVAYVDIAEVTAEALAEVAPDMIVSPVLALNFDCIDLAIRLHELGYTGRYSALTSELPDPRLIESEIAAICPQLDFEVVVTG